MSDYERGAEAIFDEHMGPYLREDDAGREWWEVPEDDMGDLRDTICRSISALPKPAEPEPARVAEAQERLIEAVKVWRRGVGSSRLLVEAVDALLAAEKAQDSGGAADDLRPGRGPAPRPVQTPAWRPLRPDHARGLRAAPAGWPGRDPPRDVRVPGWAVEPAGPWRWTERPFSRCPRRKRSDR